MPVLPRACVDEETDIREAIPVASAAFDAKLGIVLTPTEIAGCVKLSPLDDFWDHFSLPPRKRLHVIVQLPPPQREESSISLSFPFR